MIVFNVPKSCKIVKTFNTFSAVFNADPLNLGFYNFGYGTGNVNVSILDTQPNTVYLIDRATIAGNISSESFFRSLSQVPLLSFSRKIGGEIVYQTPIPATGYFQEADFTAFFVSDKETDGINCTLTGLFSQDAENIGLLTMNLFLQLTVYAIDENEYNLQFRSKDRFKGI